MKKELAREQCVVESAAGNFQMRKKLLMLTQSHGKRRKHLRKCLPLNQVSKLRASQIAQQVST